MSKIIISLKNNAIMQIKDCERRQFNDFIDLMNSFKTYIIYQGRILLRKRDIVSIEYLEEENGETQCPSNLP